MTASQLAKPASAGRIAHASFTSKPPPTDPWAPGVRAVDVPITPHPDYVSFDDVAGQFDTEFPPVKKVPQDVTDRRLKLLRAGYAPLPVHGKKPAPTKWQNLNGLSPEQVEMWGITWPHAINTGVLTRNVPTFDADILNPEAAAAIEDMVREHYEERGHLMTRIGRPPKRAFLFKTDEPFKKFAISFASGEKLEFLCDGQQVVVAGVHPDTGKPYRWHGGEPWTVAREDLPSITRDEANELMELAADLLVREFGYVRTSDRPRESKGNTRTTDSSTTEPVSDYRKAAYGQAALANIAAELASTPEGNRSDEAYKLAARAGNLVGGGCLTEGDAYARLSSAALSWGIPEYDKALGPEGTIARAIRKGMTEGKPAGPRDDVAGDGNGFGYFGYDPETGELYEDDAAEIEDAVEVFCQSAALRGTLAEQYLLSRGIEVPDEALDTLRFNASCPWELGSTVSALVALVRDITGEPVGVHLTALTPEGRKLGCMTLGPIAGHDHSQIDRRACEC